MKYLNVNQTKKIAEKSRKKGCSKILKRIFAIIKECANEGQDQVCVNWPLIADDDTINRCIDELKKLGYSGYSTKGKVCIGWGSQIYQSSNPNVVIF